MSSSDPSLRSPSSKDWFGDERPRLGNEEDHPWSRFDVGSLVGLFFLAIGIGGLLVTVTGWAALVAGPSTCISACTLELDPNNAVLVIAGLVVSIMLFSLGALFVLISALLRPR